MKLKYIKFGNGTKNMLILPGLSIKPVSDNGKAVEDAYSVFHADFTVYLFDEPDNPGAGYDLYDYARDVYETINELKIDDIYLFGVSMGGMISQILIESHPEIVKKVVLASTCLTADDLIFNEWIKLAEDKKVLELCDDFAEKVYSRNVYASLSEIIKAMAKTVDDNDLNRFIVLANACKNFKGAEKRDVRMLVLGSKDDKVMKTITMKDLANHYGAKIYLYDGYGHAVYDEAPDFKERIIDFYKGEN